jgi:hypothetical protein
VPQDPQDRNLVSSLKTQSFAQNWDSDIKTFNFSSHMATKYQPDTLKKISDSRTFFMESEVARLLWAPATWL